jgi:hypothetical protein
VLTASIYRVPLFLYKASPYIQKKPTILTSARVILPKLPCHRSIPQKTAPQSRTGVLKNKRYEGEVVYLRRRRAEMPARPNRAKAPGAGTVLKSIWTVFQFSKSASLPWKLSVPETPSPSATVN